jgi:hypothetical protein
LPECPASESELRQKFRGLVAGILPEEQAARVVESVDALDRLGDVRMLAKEIAL